jgi:Leucine-rich repeat (LRR) protein
MNISDLSPLANLTNLTTLILRNNNTITNTSIFSILANLTKLSSLDISECPIPSFEGIGAISQLTKLTLSSIPYIDLIDLSPLAELTNLTTLIMAHNPGIWETTFLSYFPNLTNLDLSYCPVSTIDGVAWLGQLDYLNLAGCCFYKLDPLFDSGCGIGSGDTVDLTDNDPIRAFTHMTLEEIYIYNNQVQTLKDKGVNVLGDFPYS